PAHVAREPGTRKRRCSGGEKAQGAGSPGRSGRAGVPRPAFLLPASSQPACQALLPKGVQRDVWRGSRGAHVKKSQIPTCRDMGVLRAGLCPGLTQEMVQLLRSRGIKTVVDLAAADLEEVAQKCGLSYKLGQTA
uniref:RAD51 paralog D n=1 Tax=Sciurus vulgaris TaxID=55149 RepID=A0A8D2CW68_SCIVU